MKPYKTFLFFFAILLLVVLFIKHDTLIGFFEREKPHTHVILITAPDSSQTIEHVSDEKTLIKDFESGTTPFLENDSALFAFFGKLNKASDSLVRIIYYGDSQIEGDLISYNLRKKFQQKFGGNGIGYMPAEMYFNTTEQLAIVTNDFDKTMIEPGQQVVKDCYGLYGRYFKPSKQDAGIRVNNRSAAHAYKRFKLIYSGSAKFLFEAGSSNTIGMELFSNEIAMEQIEIAETPSRLNLKFSNNDNFKLYAMLFDPESGVALDHVPSRGSLNLMLNHFDGACYHAMADLLQPSLVVLHYGMNVIAGRRDSYESYRIALERDIRIIQSKIPNVSVLIIGAADMAYRHAGQMKSYENIPAIIDAQRSAARNYNAAFWDMRAAMGGSNAIIDWVERGLARTDYAHLNADGARIIGEQLASDLLYAYEQYLAKE